jgi:hypothetical protein
MTDAPRDFTPCDQDLNGTESALFAVYTRTGQIRLCAHHFQRNRPAFPPDYIAVPIRPDHVHLPELGTRGGGRATRSREGSLTGAQSRLSGDITYTMRDHW